MFLLDATPLLRYRKLSNYNNIWLYKTFELYSRNNRNIYLHREQYGKNGQLSMAFKNGRQKTGGRQKGTQNKRDKSGLSIGNFKLWDGRYEGLKVLYFIKLKGTNYFKIGVSTHIYHRLLNLSSANPHKIKVLNIIVSDDFKHIEKVLHEAYRGYNIKGEWFVFSSTQVKEIVGIKNIGDALEIKEKRLGFLFPPLK